MAWWWPFGGNEKKSEEVLIGSELELSKLKKGVCVKNISGKRKLIVLIEILEEANKYILDIINIYGEYKNKGSSEYIKYIRPTLKKITAVAVDIHRFCNKEKDLYYLENKTISKKLEQTSALAEKSKLDFKNDIEPVIDAFKQVKKNIVRRIQTQLRMAA